MCTPALAAAMGLQAAGTYIARSDADKNASAVAAARNGVLQDYIHKERDLGNQARGIFNTNMETFGRPAQKQALADAQGDRTASITGNIAAPAAAPTVSGSAPDVVKGEIAKRMLDSFRASTDNAKAMGKLGGYGDTWLNNGIGVNDSARRIGTINNFAAGETAILPSQQDLAEISAYKAPSIWGPILSGAGNILAFGAGRGYSPFGMGGIGHQ